LRKWLDGILKLLWGAYLALTSLYCLLAFLPYTYYALIKAPAYSWVPFFVRHHALLFWIVSCGAAFAFRSRKSRAAYFVAFGMVACVGILVTVHPFLANLESNRAAYWVSIAALWIIVVIVALCGLQAPDEAARRSSSAEPGALQQPRFHLSYAVGIVLACGIALVSRAGAHIRNYADTRTWQWRVADLDAAFWSIVSHVIVAIVLLSLVNLIRSAASRSARPRQWRWMFLNGLIFASLWLLFLRFLENALSFDGWRAQLYAASLAGALTLLGFSVVRPFLAEIDAHATGVSSSQKIVLSCVSAAFILAALAVPTLLGGGDWNGLFQGAFTLLFWIVASLCVFRLRPLRRAYELRTIAAVVILSLAAYKGLQITQLFWAKPVGATEDEIQRGFANYGVRDVSFNLTNRMLGNGHSDTCGDLCHILREYTEVRNARTATDVKLVDPLTPASGERPNIFVFVIDSVRQDYVGAYNAKATFTPNLDALARDSVAVRNVFTPYAGTSLSEPAIWAGALLLHAHFLQPFSRVNSLEKLAKTDGYQMFVSEDEILSEILSPSDEVVKLDTDKKLWNELEVCSTIQQLETGLDHRADRTRPIFFYSQPKNVHQFGRNNLPTAKAANWPAQAGFNYRISFELHQVDECLGGFFGWLKTRGLYDNSIIIVTSDHGDATGELGRNSHSLIIYPEIMRVPLIVHLPKAMWEHLVHDDNRVSALIDITPSLYYLLGHRPIIANPLFGHPLFTQTEGELHSYHREDLLFASDVRAAYGILADNGRYFYATYDSPAQSYLYDLTLDPTGEHDILTSALKKQYDERIIEYLHEIADFYGYKPGIGSLLASSR
jgi:membrane-anchored protein YejM (alkaline phosphatase superfamily)